MKYCRTTTQTHPVLSICHTCTEDINNLIVREGYLGKIPVFTNGEIVLNMDKAEGFIARQEGRLVKKSMDMAFGISNSESKNQMQMVELRLNYTNPNNLNREEIIEKVTGTSLILSEIPPIIKFYIFIFKTEQQEEAISRLFRMIPAIRPNYVVMDIHQLKEAYF